ncbi:unnamed protein product [Rotaria socialis]|uniref:Uncharacterized protein n=1 Tax=Rotaria socialis TaxID=392032 RepID=A0A818A304_9BILA|nr:unnamed protein product [Rotaria socialis]CAF4478285.1 unnamed protein product [Rotaria socialis]
MVTRCLFGIFVFGSKSDLIYRFATDDLFSYLRKCFIDRGYTFNENPTEKVEINQDIEFSIDDAIVQHFSMLTTFHSQTAYRNNAVRRITLSSNIELFFDQIGESKIICMADDSFHTTIVLKAINLFKALAKFHIGVLPFTKSKTMDKSIDRIASSLQYYLNNIATNQALIFESCEYLHINSLIRQQCLEACTVINHDVQHWLHTAPTVVLITCKDKIVYIYTSNNQNRPSNSDLFLLILNNTSRPLRHQFKEQQNNSTNKTAHIYKTKTHHNHHNLTNSAEDIRIAQNRRSNSLPTFSQLESMKTNDDRCIEVVFMKTSNRNIAPFTMYTVPLTDDIATIILVEWKSSSACSHLSELIRQLEICTSQLQFTYTRLNTLVKPLESNSIVRRYFSSKNISPNKLSNILNETKLIYKSLKKGQDVINEDDDKGRQILKKLTDMSDFSIDLFHHLFFESNEYVIPNNNDEKTNSLRADNHLFESSPMTESLRNKLSIQLEDWFSFIEIKSQRNITMSFCNNDFPGLVHFALIDRLRGHICTPALYTDDNQNSFMSGNNLHGMEQFLEKKILKFEIECLSALQRGCTSYTMTDEHFTYNYTLRLQESNVCDYFYLLEQMKNRFHKRIRVNWEKNEGASMRLYKPFVTSEPPGILHYDFYKALAYDNYSSIVDQASLLCFELICVHLRIVPASSVRDQYEQLWPRLMELEE